MTKKSYQLFVVTTDKNMEPIPVSVKMPLEVLDDVMYQTASNSESLFFDLKVLYPELRDYEISKVFIGYQQDKKIKKIETIFADDKHHLEINYLQYRALSLFDNSSFFNQLVKPYAIDKPFPLANLSNQLVAMNRIAAKGLMDSSEYDYYYRLKTLFLLEYLVPKGNVNYLHKRKLLEIIKTTTKSSSITQMALERPLSIRDAARVFKNSSVIPDYERRLLTLKSGLEQKFYDTVCYENEIMAATPPMSNQSNEKEADDELIGLYSDSYLSRDDQKLLKLIDEPRIILDGRRNQ